MAFTPQVYNQHGFSKIEVSWLKVDSVVSYGIFLLVCFMQLLTYVPEG